jgi:hypothetical protein
MIESGEESQVAIAFFLGAGVMALGGIAELLFGVKAEKQSLESIAKPLTAQEGEAAAGEERSEAGQQKPRPRRRRPGPGTAHSSPGMWVSQSVPAADLRREVEAIERILAERSPIERRELAREVGARFWGPGRFGAALREAIESGRAKRAGRNRYLRA